jgi:F-box-like
MLRFSYRPAGIHSLPVELLTRIFILGAGYDYPYSRSPFLLKPDQDYYAAPSSNFQVLASHVCHHWRQIALRTSCLWNTLHFREPTHLERAAEFLARCSASGQLLDILVDTVAARDHIPGVTLCREEIQEVFDIIVPHVKRWRAFHLKVRENECKLTARQYLSSCGPAPNLETLQLYHFEDYRTSQNLYLATYRPPVMVFSNNLPRLKNVSLIGVNLPWAHSPYLVHLHNLELALHPESIRPPYEYWDIMLRNSPELRALSLHYSGPARVANGDGNTKVVWPSTGEKIYIGTLEMLSLTDLDPDYLCLLLERLVMPGLKQLSLDLPDQDFTPFMKLVVGEQIQEPQTLASSSDASSSRSSPEASSTRSSLTPSVMSPIHLPFPALAKLETLVISALECSAESFYAFLLRLEGLRCLEMHFSPIGDEFLRVLMLPVPAQERAGYVPLLPGLRVVKMSGLRGEKVAEFIEYRENVGTERGEKVTNSRGGMYKVERWIVEWSARQRGRDPVLDELVDEGWGGKDGRKVKVGWYEGEEEEGEEEEEEEEEDDGVVVEEEEEDDEEEDA